MKPLTTKQQRVLEYICEFIQQNSFPPTVREISNHFHITVRAGYGHLQALETKRYIEMNRNKSRTIRVLAATTATSELNHGLVELPILGTVSAGSPLLAFENYETTIQIPYSNTKGNECFAVHVRGDSMRDAGILDKDIAIIRRQQTAENGQIVVAAIGDDAVTLKRFYREENRICLRSENPNYSDLFSRNVRIIGRLIRIIRPYE